MGSLSVHLLAYVIKQILIKHHIIMKAPETGYWIDWFRLGNVSRPTLCSHKNFVCQCADLVMISLPLPRFHNELWLSSVVSLKPCKRDLVIILSERFGSINRVNPRS